MWGPNIEADLHIQSLFTFYYFWNSEETPIEINGEINIVGKSELNWAEMDQRIYGERFGNDWERLDLNENSKISLNCSPVRRDPIICSGPVFSNKVALKQLPSEYLGISSHIVIANDYLHNQNGYTHYK